MHACKGTIKWMAFFTRALKHHAGMCIHDHASMHIVIVIYWQACAYIELPVVTMQVNIKNTYRVDLYE